jgi:hypothetical protein
VVSGRPTGELASGQRVSTAKTSGRTLDVYEEHFWEARPVHFEYYYVGLPALDAETYLTGANWLGVALAVLMRCPRERRASVGAEAIRRVVGSPLNDWQKYLLCECVQAYTPLDEGQRKNLTSYCSVSLTRECNQW